MRSTATGQSLWAWTRPPIRRKPLKSCASCGVSFLVTSDDGWKKISPEVSADTSGLTTIVAGGDPKSKLDPGCYSLEQLTSERSGDESDSIDLPGPGDLATIVYTSGTTGAAKGIPYRHDQLMAACRSLYRAYSELEPGDRTICWLPLSAMFQRMANLLSIACGMITYLVDNPRSVFEDITSIKPHFFIGVPRFYEKLDEAITDNDSTPILEGLSQVKLMISGSAPISVAILESLQQHGIAVREAYGLSENLVPVALNRLSDYRFGTVGKPLEPNTVKLADDGEILVKGPGLFSGYLGDVQEGDRFTEDGFYRTGDVGAFDQDGFLSITGRNSDLFKTSTGRRVSPTKVEAAYAKCRYVNQMVVIGAGRKYLAALITPSEYSMPSEDLTPQMLDEIKSELLAAGESLNPYERVQAFGLLPRPFISDELTPTQKLRRGVILTKYASLIDRLYQEPIPCVVVLPVP